MGSSVSKTQVDARGSARERTIAEAGRLGLWSGALAGLFVAMGDFGAMWLWLPLWRDRGSFLLRMLGALVPAGAFLGLSLACVGALAWTRVRRFERRAALVWPLPFAIFALAPARWLALKLCSGGMMSRLALRGVIEWTLTLAMPMALFGVLYWSLRTGRKVANNTRRARWTGVALLTSSFLLGKLNQVFLPNLYDYLHACLALLTWSTAALGTASLLGVDDALDGLRARAREAGPSVALGLISLCLFAADALTLDGNLNVRVAMFDARAPASRALLAGLDPALRALSGRQRDGRAAAALIRSKVDTTGLPSSPGAHVLLITVDALRADHLGSYGYGRPTSPALDALARQSVQFQHAYAQAPHSSYSLSSLHTSEYLHEVVELGRGLPEATLATTLAAHGYHTAAFFTDGIFHTEGQRLAQYRDAAFGFALFDNTNRESEDQTDRVLAEVDRIKGLGEPPSFLWVHYFDVHEPYQETSFGTGEMDRYDSEIKHVDRELARLLRAMDERFEREVIVAITADHGEEFREHGGVYHGSTLYEEQVHVPLILRAPGLSAKQVAEPVEVIDIAPSLLALVGVEAAPTMRGRDLRAVTLGRVPDVGPVFSAVLTKRMGVRWPHKIVADLRFGLYELYDLEADPHERKNLASSEPQRVEEMRSIVYAWLDSLEKTPGGGATETREHTWARALRLGRLGDRRAVELAVKLLLDRNAPTEARAEAGQILAKLADESSAPALVQGMQTEPFEVAAEAAIALGRMYDPRARDALKRLIHVEDPYLRARAAVSLGRLRDREAVPALIDALWVAPTQYEREEAVRWLGRLRDKRALEPLLSLIPEFGMRYLVTVALGQLGDERAFDVLADMLTWENRTNIRDEMMRGFGYLGDARALPILTGLLADEPGLKNTAESLVRLKAIARGYLGGTDVGPGMRGAAGLVDCQEGPLFHDWDYLERTSCVTTGQRPGLALAIPHSHASWQNGAQLVLRARAEEPNMSVTLALSMGGKSLGSVRVEHSWNEYRVPVPAELLQQATATLILELSDPRQAVVLDHALLVPLTSAPKLSSGAEPASDAKPIP